jgi:hypothetical protein
MNGRHGFNATPLSCVKLLPIPPCARILPHSSQGSTEGGEKGTTMKALKRLGLLLELALLGTSITTGGPIGDQVKMIAVVVMAAIGAMAVFCGVVLTIAVIQQRQPPYEM